MDSEARTGGQILVDQLLVHGVDLAACVPGESYLAVLDALRDVAARIRLLTCRHEAAAANMAEAHGKLTGRPGVCLVTRGPGATHASIGVHTAAQDSTPMVLIVGQVPRAHRGREAFQEIDVAATFGSLAKWVVEVDDPCRLPELVARAFTTAASGRPGPVVIAVPEDVLTEECAVADARPYVVARASVGAADVQRLRAVLGEAERPLVIVGGGGWSARASADLESFAAANDLPVAVSFRRQDYLDNASPQFVGQVGLALDSALAERLRAADVVLAIGTRLAQATTGAYTLIEAPAPRQRLVHTHPDPDELGRVYQPELALNTGSAELLAALAASAPLTPRWAGWRADARRDYERFARPEGHSGDLDLTAVMGQLDARLPADAIVANGAGNFAVWVQRYHRYRGYGTQLAPTSGAMGYGLPAGIAAKAAHPERTVVALAGDGCFMMSGHELATAVQHDIAVVVIVVNNQRYGTIRMHQDQTYPGRPYATDLVTPDFVAYAAAFGAHAELVEATADFAGALDRALDAGRPALLELRVDPDRLTP